MEITLNDIKIAYDDRGAGPAVLLIHGFPLNRTMWQPQLEALSRAGYRVIAPDLRGFGESDAPEGGYSMDRFADDLVALLDALKIERAVVAGMSMGGYILLNLLERYQERVAAAAFIVTRSTAEDEAGRARRTALAAEAERLGVNPIIKIFAELLFAPDTIQTNPQLVAQVTAWMRGTSPKGLAGGLLSMRDRKDYTPLLPTFHPPALVVTGAEDRAGAPEAAELFAKGLRRCTSRVIPRAGHMANLEQPEEFNAALVEFLHSVREKMPG
ncbi:alpha/beta hydrolase [Geomonas sp. RF6]|uniref:alpha/beta fold hydrolase n=1 Tax=Geomonas sp. RF6 TaxID=2897342 RepID=UPI001E3C0DEA|nr:alpha/beta fold hydrolase [Geomonas sp. RF6]UFS72610.1 alpha/beta hydrolase [Geomonas sp. RF6]